MILLKRNVVFICLLLLISAEGLSAQKKSNDYLKAAIEATHQKQYTQAIKYCDSAVKLNSTLVEAYFHRGFNKLKLKDYTGAKVDFSICLELNRDNLSAYLYRGLTNQKLGNTWEASRDFMSARSIDTLETLSFITVNVFR